MIKIVTDDEELIVDMSENITEDGMSEACSNCAAVKDAVKRNDEKEFSFLTGFEGEDALEEMGRCKRCIWYYIDEVEVI